MTRKGRRLVLIGVGLAVLGLAAGLILTALNDTIVFFRTPTEVAEHKVAPGTRTRLGGLVETGSLVKDGASVRFAVTDGNARVTIAYTGILPDLFREGQGVVAEGAVQPDGLFKADTVLAKHDEKYMPREVADALKQQGHWMEEAQQAKPGTADGPAKPKPAAATPAAATPAAPKPVSVPPGSLTQ